MFNQHLFHLVTRLISSRRTRDERFDHSAWADSHRARLGPLHLAVSAGFTMDYDGADLSVVIPVPGGRLRLGVTAYRGADAPDSCRCYSYRLPA